MKKNLFITFPVDSGMKSSHDNYLNNFSNDFNFASFSYKYDQKENYNKYIRKKRYRIISSIKLRSLINKYSKKNDKIIFHGLSPMIYTIGSYKFKNTILSLDSTRALKDFVINKTIKKDFVFYIHRWILSKTPSILCWTDEVIRMLNSTYNIPKSQLFKILPPFQLKTFLTKPRKTPNKPQVLFIGREFERKGGDIVLHNFDKIKDKCNLTIVSENINILANKIKGVSFFECNLDKQKLKELYISHDILILPTKFDPYGLVLAEAASAGLAVITTKFALGSKDVVINNQSGFICESQQECIDKLSILLNDLKLIDQFKLMSFKNIKIKFDQQKSHKSFLHLVNQSKINESNK